MTKLSLVSQQGVAFYDARPHEFLLAVTGRQPVADALWLAQELPAASLVVDAGCGTGEDSAFLAQSGLRVYAYDGSVEMTRLTTTKLEAYLGSSAATVHCHRHDELQLREPAAAILASASLLFLESDDLKAALQALARNLAPGGRLLASFKSGPRPRPQLDGRTYFDRTPDHLNWFADASGLVGEGVREQKDVLGRGQSWLTFVLRKPA